jgi:hypothetical protein
MSAAPPWGPASGSAQGSPARATARSYVRNRNCKPASYFLRRAPERFAARKEIPARIAFCWTAAAVRPSFFATCPVGVPDFASALRVISSRALQDAPSFGGRRAIIPTPNHPTKGRTLDNTPINGRVRPENGPQHVRKVPLAAFFVRVTCCSEAADSKTLTCNCLPRPLPGSATAEQVAYRHATYHVTAPAEVVECTRPGWRAENARVPAATQQTRSRASSITDTQRRPTRPSPRHLAGSSGRKSSSSHRHAVGLSAASGLHNILIRQANSARTTLGERGAPSAPLSLPTSGPTAAQPAVRVASLGCDARTAQS